MPITMISCTISVFYWSPR